MYDTLYKTLQDSGMEEAIRSKVDGSRICIASRYRPNRNINSIYAVLGFSIGSLFEMCGAKVDYHFVPRKGVQPLDSSYDHCFLCYYYTDVMVREIAPLMKSIKAKCKRRYYYTNLIPASSIFDAYFLSRKAYLNLSNPYYKNGQYNSPRQRLLSRSYFVGRGADTELLYPNQDEFTVLVDGSRGPTDAPTIKMSLDIIESLTKRGYKVDFLGFNRAGKARPKEKFTDVVEVYKRAHVYISGISGLYELPVIETQACGAHVVSMKNRLHTDLMNPSTSHHYSKINDHAFEMLEHLKENFDPNPARNFVLNGFRWVDVIGRMLPHM